MFRSLPIRRGIAPALACTILLVILAAFTAGSPPAGAQTPAPAAPTSPAQPSPAQQQAAPPSAAQEEQTGPERNAAMETFLQFLNKSPEATLRKHTGLTKDVVDRIMANRAAGKAFASIPEFRGITKISSMDFEHAFKPFFEADLRKTTLAATRKPVQPVSASDPKKPGASAAGTTPPPPPAGGVEGPIGAVRAGYYAKLEGYDSWDGIDPAVKKEFFETINRERCTCGCTNETLAWCYVNDPSCPVVRPRVKKIHDDLMKRVAANPAPAQPAPNPR